MEREGEAESKRAVMENKNTYVNPLLKGCLTGVYQAIFISCNRSIKAHLDQIDGRSSKLHDLKLANILRMLRLDMLTGVTHSPISLGLFEILSNNLRSTNHGVPLSLYQEACCGLASGTTAAFVYWPFFMASSQILARKQNYSYTNMLGNLHHIVRDEGVLALWNAKGSGLFISSLAAANVGMLTSYKRTRDYLMESKGLSNWNAELSASIVSGFFAAACSHSCTYMKAIKDVVDEKYVAGEKNAYRKIPLCITRILTPHSGFKFYIGFLNHFRRWAGFCMVQWWIYERIRFEE